MFNSLNLTIICYSVIVSLGFSTLLIIPSAASYTAINITLIFVGGAELLSEVNERNHLGFLFHKKTSVRTHITP